MIQWITLMFQNLIYYINNIFLLGSILNVLLIFYLKYNLNKQQESIDTQLQKEQIKQSKQSKQAQQDQHCECWEQSKAKRIQKLFISKTTSNK
jgi:short subunit fatty acids transporter